MKDINLKKVDYGRLAMEQTAKLTQEKYASAQKYNSNVYKRYINDVYITDNITTLSFESTQSSVVSVDINFVLDNDNVTSNFELMLLLNNNIVHSTSYNAQNLHRYNETIKIMTYKDNELTIMLQASSGVSLKQMCVQLSGNINVVDLAYKDVIVDSKIDGSEVVAITNIDNNASIETYTSAQDFIDNYVYSNDKQVTYSQVIDTCYALKYNLGYYNDEQFVVTSSASQEVVYVKNVSGTKLALINTTGIKVYAVNGVYVDGQSMIAVCQVYANVLKVYLYDTDLVLIDTIVKTLNIKNGIKKVITIKQAQSQSANATNMLSAVLITTNDQAYILYANVSGSSISYNAQLQHIGKGSTGSASSSDDGFYIILNNKTDNSVVYKHYVLKQVAKKYKKIMEIKRYNYKMGVFVGNAPMLMNGNTFVQYNDN